MRRTRGHKGLHLKTPQNPYRVIRARRPHRVRRTRSQARERMRAFGVLRKRYLTVLPILLIAIILSSLYKTPPQTVARFRPADPQHVNPLMGWAPDAATDPTNVAIDHALVYATLSWREFEPEEGVYDFASFEALNHLDRWWIEGKQLVMRFVMDVPGEEKHTDLPDWLMDAMGADAGTYYDNSLGQGFSPNYGNWLLMERHERALKALGARYDAHAGVAFIEMGSLGHNGGWVVEDVPGDWAMPPAEELRAWAWQYVTAFPNTPVLASAPYQPMRTLGLGLYNDDLGNVAKTWDWLDVVEYGGYDARVGAELRAVPSALLSLPSGARIAQGTNQHFLFTTGASALLRQITASHTTYVSGVDAVDVTEEMQAGMAVAMNTMGYRLWVREAAWPSRVRAGYRMSVNLDMRNNGAQAFSQSWPVELSLLNGDEVVYREVTDVDLRTILPGVTKLALRMKIPRELRGEFTLALAILAPDTREPSVSLCMNGAKYGLRQALGTVRVHA